MDAPFGGILTAHFVCQRVTGTLGRPASRAFLSGKGRFLCPLTGPFSHALFLFFPSPGFFCLRGPLPSWIANWQCYAVNGMTNSESCSEHSPQFPERMPGRNWPPRNPEMCLVFCICRIPRAVPRIPRNSPRGLRHFPGTRPVSIGILPQTPPCHFLYARKGKCCAFFCGAFFRRLPPFFPKFYPS